MNVYVGSSNVDLHGRRVWKAECVGPCNLVGRQHNYCDSSTLAISLQEGRDFVTTAECGGV